MHSSISVSPRVAARSLTTVLLVVAFVGSGTLMAQTAQPPAAPKPAPPKPAAPKAEPSARDVPARDVPLPSARSIIDRHVKEMGGRAAILGHTSSHATGTITMTGSEITGAVDVYAAKPDKSFVRINLGGIGDILEGFDGTTGWTLQPLTGPMLAEGQELAEKKFDADFYSDLHDPARYTSIKTIEKTTFDGRPCYKISLIKPDGGEDFEFYDVGTGLKAGATATRHSSMGPITATQVLADYKKFGDLLVPTTMRQTQMGIEQQLKITVVEWDKVPPSTFDPPAQIKALIK
jgi:hypothetical protein